MRDGIFGGRNLFNADTNIGNLDFDVSGSGDFQIRMGVQNDESLLDLFAKPVSDISNYTLLDDTADTILYDPTFFTSDSTAGQIILNNINSSMSNDGYFYASFWIEIIDTVDDGYYAQLTGRMWAPDGAGGRPVNPFPDADTSIIPLALIKANAVGYFIEQIQSGNIVNRYPPDYTTFRGLWSADNLSGQYFFNGDIVRDDTLPPYFLLVENNPPGGTIGFFREYKYIGGWNKETARPTPGTKWQAIRSTAN